MKDKIKQKIEKLKISKRKVENRIVKVTNKTLEAERKEILKNGKKFKYPVQYSKNKLIINSVVIFLVFLSFGFFALRHKLYVEQSTEDMIYQIVKFLPFPVAEVDGEKVLYSDYLKEFRSNFSYYSKQKDSIEANSSEEESRRHYKRQSLDNAIQKAYAKKIAREHNIKVSKDEIDEYFNYFRKSINGEIDEKTFNQINENNFKLSPEDYKKLFIENPIIQQKVSVLIDKEAENTKNEIVEFLKNNENDFSKVAEKFGEKVQVGKSGNVKHINTDGGRTEKALKLKEGEVSDAFVSRGGNEYYIVKLTSKTDNDLSYDYIKISFTEFAKRIEQLKKDKKIKEYIKIEEN